MAKVVINESLAEQISRKFKRESVEIFSLMRTLEDNPKKGKEIGVVGSILVKEIKYNQFRFYFITDGYKVKFLKTEQLKDLLIRFVRMSDKRDQQKTINEIKHILRELGEEGF